MIIKRKHIFNYDFKCLVWVNFGPSSKNITPQKHYGVLQWGKFEQFQHQIPKGSLVVKVI
jgi:hypothetical protein